MARMKGNIAMTNVRGMFGKQVVYKSRLGIPYVSAPPNVKENRRVSNAEQSNRDRFRESNDYAKDAIQDVELKALYKSLAKEGQTAYNAAMSDAFHPPQITAIFTHGYKGNVGDEILIQAKDNFKVTKVQLVIFDAQRNIVEKGYAADTGDGFNWMYKVTTELANPLDVTLQIRAFDIAQNETVRVVILS